MILWGVLIVVTVLYVRMGRGEDVTTVLLVVFEI